MIATLLLKSVALLVPIVILLTVAAFPRSRRWVERHHGTPMPWEDARALLVRPRTWGVHAIIMIVIGGFFFDAWKMTEHWPFSYFPMFSGVQEREITQIRIAGVTADGREVAVKIVHIRGGRLRRVLMRGGEEGSTHNFVATAAQRVIELHNEGSQDTPIVAIRLYEDSWTIQPWATNRHTPDATRLIHEFR